MRVRLWRPLLVAVAVWAAAGTTARAQHCGACTYPDSCCSPEQQCMPRVRYRCCYETVVEERTWSAHQRIAVRRA